MLVSFRKHKDTWLITNCICIGISLGLYFINQIILKNSFQVGLLGRFLKNHLNDLLVPFVVIPYAQVILSFLKIKITKCLYLLIFINACGIIWEFIIPLINHNAVSDPHDFICYNIGCLLYWVIVIRSE